MLEVHLYGPFTSGAFIHVSLYLIGAFSSKYTSSLRNEHSKRHTRNSAGDKVPERDVFKN